MSADFTPPRGITYSTKLGDAANVLRLTNELEELLGRYLDTMPPQEAEEALAEFTTPRSRQIDELLRRSQLDGDMAVLGDLEQSLREHLVAVDRGDSRETSGSQEYIKWRKRTASDIHRMVRVSDRVRSYAELVAAEDERVHRFDDEHESTIRGMPPPNAPPIGIGAKHRRSRER